MPYTVDAAACSLYFDAMPIGFTVIELQLDEAGRPIDFIFRYANEALARLEGKPLDELIGRYFYRDVFSQDSDKKCLAHYYRSAYCGKQCELHEYSRELGKHLRILSYPWQAPGFCACILIDETESKRQWDELDFLASFDSLTRMLNRNSYHEYCASRAPGGSAGVIYVDVNGLKESNDCYGHEAGDRLIREVSGRISAAMRDRSCMIFRVGGDEFAVVMDGCSKEAAEAAAEDVRRALVNRAEAHIPPMLAAVGCSWGEDVHQINSLLRQADAAMYANKQDHYRCRGEGQASDWQRALPRIRSMIEQQMNEDTDSAVSMWRDSYRIGVESIDAQHRELFRMTEELLTAIASDAGPEAYSRILGFLKEYVVYHFRNEERYQAAIGYSGLEAHRREHQRFTRTVLEHEKKMREGGFARSDVKDLAGTLVAWLVYHVIDTDRRIVYGQKETAGQRPVTDWADAFAEGVAGLLVKISGLHEDGIRRRGWAAGSTQNGVVLEAGVAGDAAGRVFFSVSRELALDVLSGLVMRRLSDVEELVCSAMCEFADIACRRAAEQLEAQGVHCRVQAPRPVPAVPALARTMRFETDAGWVEVSVVQA